MKELAFFVVLVLVFGVGGFLYRYTLEQPGSVPEGPAGGQIACTLDAMICPDGKAVGRTGPNCEFAACPIPETATSSLEVATSSPETATSSLEFPEN